MEISMDISIPMQTRMKEDSSMIDLSLDYHAHILPGCDHGSSSVDMSLKQMDMAKEAGIQTICATPHFYPHKESVSSFIERRRQTADNLWTQIPASPAGVHSFLRGRVHEDRSTVPFRRKSAPQLLTKHAVNSASKERMNSCWRCRFIVGRLLFGIHCID